MGRVLTVSRRRFLAGAAAALATARATTALVGPTAVAGAAGADDLPADPFTLGVASGDPTPDGVVLWTRLAPEPTSGGGMPPDDVAVTWEVATDDTFTTIVATGVEPAVAALAHSVHVEVGGLVPDTWYAYRFRAAGWTSPTGRTRTTPEPWARTPLRLGAASCQHWRAGYYTAHAHLAQEGCDVVVWLGDYIYENAGNGPVRNHVGPECRTLDQYRNRYGQYKGDANLQAAHHACPWVVIWDDHEVDDNYAGAFSNDGTDEATFLVRRAAAYQAWWEHQPVRLGQPTGPDYEIYRRFAWGSLALLHLPDTRQHRSDQACGDGLAEACPEQAEPARTLLGATQESWLLDGFDASTAVWDVFAQQIVFAPMPIGDAVNMDQWDGYPAQRARVWPVLKQTSNPVVLSGDIHFNALVRLHDTLNDATTARRGTEIVVGSISSQFTTAPAGAVKAFIENIPWWDHVNAAERGYAIIDLTSEHLHAELRVVSTALQPEATVRTDATVDVDAVFVAPPEPPTTTTTSSTTTTTDPGSTTSTSSTSTSTTSPTTTSSSTTSSSTSSTTSSTSTSSTTTSTTSTTAAPTTTTTSPPAGTTTTAPAVDPAVAASATPTFSG